MFFSDNALPSLMKEVDKNTALHLFSLGYEYRPNHNELNQFGQFINYLSQYNVTNREFFKLLMSHINNSHNFYEYNPRYLENIASVIKNGMYANEIIEYFSDKNFNLKDKYTTSPCMCVSISSLSLFNQYEFKTQEHIESYMIMLVNDFNQKEIKEQLSLTHTGYYYAENTKQFNLYFTGHANMDIIQHILDSRFEYYRVLARERALAPDFMKTVLESKLMHELPHQENNCTDKKLKTFKI